MARLGSAWCLSTSTATFEPADESHFKTEALSRLTAQHDEITRLRTAHTATANVRRLPTRAVTIGPC
jgi:hypothetical protein